MGKIQECNIIQPTMYRPMHGTTLICNAHASLMTESDRERERERERARERDRERKRVKEIE